MLKAVPESSFASFRDAVLREEFDWYAIGRGGDVMRATSGVIEAALEEELWGDQPTHVFVLGAPDGVLYDDVYSARTDRTAFRKYEDGDRMFVLNFESIRLPGVEVEDANWYLR